MSEQDRIAFEALNRLIEQDHKVPQGSMTLGIISERLNHRYKTGFIEGYKAATAEANKRIEALEGEVAELKSQKVRHDQLVDYLKCGIAEELEQRILELQSSNNTLREALGKIKVTNDKYIKDGHIDHIVCNAIYSTPVESL